MKTTIYTILLSVFCSANLFAQGANNQGIEIRKGGGGGLGAYEGTGGIAVSTNSDRIVIDGSAIAAGATPAYAITNRQTGAPFTNQTALRQEGGVIVTALPSNSIPRFSGNRMLTNMSNARYVETTDSASNIVARTAPGTNVLLGIGEHSIIDAIVPVGVSISGYGPEQTRVTDGYSALLANFIVNSDVSVSGVKVTGAQPITIQDTGISTTTNVVIRNSDLRGITDAIQFNSHGTGQVLTVTDSRIESAWDQVLLGGTNTGGTFTLERISMYGDVLLDSAFGSNLDRVLSGFVIAHGGQFDLNNILIVHTNGMRSSFLQIQEAPKAIRMRIAKSSYFTAVTNGGVIVPFDIPTGATNTFIEYVDMPLFDLATNAPIYTNTHGPQSTLMVSTGPRTNWLPQIGFGGIVRFPGMEQEVRDGAGTAGTSAITIRALGGATIDGNASVSINNNYGAIGFKVVGTNWQTYRVNEAIVSQRIPSNNGNSTNLSNYGTFTGVDGLQSGTWIFTGTLEAPSGADPSTPEPAQFAFDNNFWGMNLGAYQGNDGTENVILVHTAKGDVPSNGQVLTWLTGGKPSWEDPTGGSGTPGGAQPMLQMNLGGAFVGTTNLTYDNSNNILRMAASALGDALIDIKDASAPNATNRIGSQFIGMRNNYNFGIRNNDTNNWIFGQAGNLTPATDNYHAIGSPALRAIGAFSTLSNNVLVKPSIAPPGAGGLVHLNGTNNNWFVSATTNVLLALTNLKSGVDYSLAVSNGANVVVTLSNAAAIKVPYLPAGQFPSFNSNGFTYMTFRIDDVSVSTNLVAVATTDMSLVAGWKLGMGTNAATQVVTLNVTNAQTLIASNQTSVQVDFSAGTPDYYSTDVMRANLSVQPTNLVVGRTATIYLTGDTNSNERTVTVITNGIAGGAAIRWFFNTPTNGATSFTVTNTQRAELSLKVLSATEIWAAWSPVR